MKINKLFSALTIIGLSLSLSFAQSLDFDNFGDFGQDSSSNSSSKLNANGSVEMDFRSYVDKDEVSDALLKADPKAKINLKYDASSADLILNLNVNQNVIKNNPEDIIDEAILRSYFGNFTFELGKEKVVWGKGDKLHVLDNFNADDYSDFIIPDYIDRRIATPMIRGVYSFGVANLQAEAIYTPFLPTDRFAKNGVWTPAQFSSIKSNVTNNVTNKVAQSFKQYNEKMSQATIAGYIAQQAAENYKAEPTNMAKAQTAQQAAAAYKTANEQATLASTTYLTYLTNASSLSNNNDIIYPEMFTLKYGQYGARLTGTVGTFDWGLSYYNGYYKQPSLNAQKFENYITEYLTNGSATENSKFLSYDKKQTFGFEFATTVWHFNLRGEAGFNLTHDIEGNDPYVHNNSVCYLAGFDIDLPFWNANLNVQEYGTAILNSDECKKSKLDVDYDKNGFYTNNKIVVNFSTSFVNDKVCPEVTVLYGFENGDLVVLPKIAFKPVSELSLNLSGMYIWTKDDCSEFDAWKKNSFVQLGATYKF